MRIMVIMRIMVVMRILVIMKMIMNAHGGFIPDEAKQ